MIKSKVIGSIGPTFFFIYYVVSGDISLILSYLVGAHIGSIWLEE